MTQFKITANIREINRYDFSVEANSKEEAQEKVAEYLKDNCPYPYDNDKNGVNCTDREPAMETEEVVKIF